MQTTERTSVEIAGRTLPALWVTEIPCGLGEYTEWWAERVAAIPLENGWVGYVVGPDRDPRVDQWAAHLFRPEEIAPPIAQGRPEEGGFVREGEAAVLARLLEWSERPSPTR